MGRNNSVEAINASEQTTANTTTLDNEAGLASGRSETSLSSAGEAQARALGARRAGDRFDAVFASDLERARRTAELAFASHGLLIECDERLREIDYGALTCQPRAVIDAVRATTSTSRSPVARATARRRHASLNT